MSRIPVDDIATYQSFFPSLEYALRLVRSELGKQQRRKLLSLDELGALIDGSTNLSKDSFRSYRRARDGFIRLDPYVFFKIIKFLENNKLPSNMIDDIKKAYEIYQYIEKNLTSKRNPFRGTSSISNANVDTKFWALIRDNGFLIPDVVNGDVLSFYTFMDQVSEVPFRDNDIRKCINNCYVVSKFLINHRNDEFYVWDERTFSIRLSAVVRIGAWACQAVGQRGLFNEFLKMSNKGYDKTIPQTVIGNSMVKYHDMRWKRFVGVHSESERDMIRTAYQAVKAVDQFDPLNESSVIMLNAVGDSVREGAGFMDKIGGIDDKTIQSIIDEAEEIGAFGAYELGAALHRAELKILSLLNSGDTELANAEMGKYIALFKNSESENKYFEMKVNRTSGLLLQKTTKNKENLPLIRAYDIAVEMGAFQYAVEIAGLMEWK